jgi:hypothetical protein
MVKHRLCWLLSLAIAGCGGSSPTTPSPGGSDSPGPQFATGRYRLKMIAFDVSSDPLLLPCPAWLGVPSIGKSVTLELDVVKDGVEWVGRPSGAAGDVEVRFSDAGQLPTGRRAIAGSIRGQAPDMGIPGSVAPRDVSVTVAGTGATGAVLDGQTAFSVAVDTLTGRAVGSFRFNDSVGDVVICPAVSVQMNVLK